jgi:NAD(P)-dependent dehydrogenase (short-subunit alcohol dehydrogenase family)
MSMLISSGLWSITPVRPGWLAAAGGVARLGAVAGVGVALAAAVIRSRHRWDLADGTVLVTGGSRGLGLLVAEELLRAGARVAICARDQDTLDRARAQLAQVSGGRVLAIPCDVSVRDDVENMVRQVTEQVGPIDAVINNAGTIVVGPADVMELEDFEEAMSINFWGPLHAILAVLPEMRRRGAGRIVNVASIGGKVSVPHLLPYCASKFALVGLSEGLRAELAIDGIQVSTICPGLMRTGSPRHALFKGQHRAEYAWFSISDSLPLISMSAERAARQIVAALRYGTASRILSLPARLAVVMHGLLPGLTADMLGLVNRGLPGSEGEPARPRVKGEASTSEISPSWLTSLNEQAARRANQV